MDRAGAAAAPSRQGVKFHTLSAQGLVDALVNQSFPHPQQIPTIALAVAPNNYLGANFGISPTQTLWRPDHGSMYGHNAYWIFVPNQRLCWQVPPAGGPLAYWNQDGQAAGNPQDWELFLFEAHDAANGLVKIRSLYGKYVNFVDPFFQCSGDASAATVFLVTNE